MDLNSFLNIDNEFRKSNSLQFFEDPITHPLTLATPNPQSGRAEPASEWEASQGSGIPDDLWDDTGFRIPESWSQTLDSLLSQAISGQKVNEQSSSDAKPSSTDSNTLFNGSTPSSASSTSSSCPSTNESALSQSEKEWQFLLSSTPSDPFNIYPLDPPPPNTYLNEVKCETPGAAPGVLGFLPVPDAGAASRAPLAHNAPLPSGALPKTESNAAPLYNCETSRDPAPYSPFGRLFETTQSAAAETSGYISPADLSLHSVSKSIPRFDIPIDPLPHSNPAHFAEPQRPPGHPSGARTGQVQPAVPLVSRGLAGWNPLNNRDEPVLKAIAAAIAPSAPAPGSSILALKPPCPRPSVSRPVLDCDTKPTESTSRPPKQERRSKFSVTSLHDMLGSDDILDDDDDSDVYQPSSSPGGSVVGSRSASPASFQFPVPFQDESEAGDSQTKSRRGKGKAKGSAAFALAVVTQMNKLQESYTKGGNEFLQDTDGPEFDARLRAIRPGRKRKNNHIPLPVPVPHLIKKSRGRKVPFVAPVESELQSPSVPANEGEGGASVEEVGPGPARPARGGRGRKSVTPYSLAEGGKRAYMCEVAGCGKCFVRGEHLKRHVRSIHTYDKPHPCPYAGCDKSFSRRDNLGQHVRIHLQS